jgi:hypothetical protein
MAATSTKWSAVGGRYSLRENSRTTTAYLMKAALSVGMPLKPNHLLPTQTPRFQGNKRSTLSLSPVSSNVIFTQRNSM